ncbi:RNA polymerase sigma factor [Limnoglobus roseus]|uniref:Sigma-70 family RNA polymerase sigma factor n=1 Tax=Limnoglobus roseus TaxID=2598579 RepID=A0A5C1A361_9BACT|nr:sigma-70 family RNA polymerase sigma factor [Limnoglobus roseus]QEL13541.1 sigma-70 family RNA polymerase sigma factor [Limnoglobus roseus]
MDKSLHTTQLCQLIEEVSRGSQAAKNELFERIDRRFLQLARRMLGGFPRLRGLEQTDDVLQLARMRLLQSLGLLEFQSVRAFFGLIAEILRRTLLDLVRHHYGRAPRAQRCNIDPEDAGLADPQVLRRQLRLEIHEAVERLSAEERELVDLLYYDGFTQEEVAELFGTNVRTVQRHWARAKAKLLTLLKS